jgi:hypothetical protein
MDEQSWNYQLDGTPAQWLALALANMAPNIQWQVTASDKGILYLDVRAEIRVNGSLWHYWHTAYLPGLMSFREKEVRRIVNECAHCLALFAMGVKEPA